jgi:hypothetical protein
MLVARYSAPALVLDNSDKYVHFSILMFKVIMATLAIVHTILSVQTLSNQKVANAIDGVVKVAAAMAKV